MATAPASGRPPASTTGRIETLKRRAEFLATRKGARWASPRFVLEALERGPAQTADGARFGFTVSRQVGKAVERNRIRRRLKAAVGQVQGAHARANFDYVLIARRAALEAAFDTLVSDLIAALARVNGTAQGQKRRAKTNSP